MACWEPGRVPGQPRVGSFWSHVLSEGLGECIQVLGIPRTSASVGHRPNQMSPAPPSPPFSHMKPTGDLGCNGLGIPIGKLDLYVAAGGFHPSRVLPCVIDVGTNNEALRCDQWYMGLKQPRLAGDAYYQLVDEFVQAVMGRWPHAVLQFEDFALEHAGPLLKRYRDHHTVFNDDIQARCGRGARGGGGGEIPQGRVP